MTSLPNYWKAETPALSRGLEFFFSTKKIKIEASKNVTHLTLRDEEEGVIQ